MGEIRARNEQGRPHFQGVSEPVAERETVLPSLIPHNDRKDLHSSQRLLEKREMDLDGMFLSVAALRDFDKFPVTANRIAKFRIDFQLSERGAVCPAGENRHPVEIFTVTGRDDDDAVPSPPFKQPVAMSGGKPGILIAGMREDERDDRSAPRSDPRPIHRS